MKNIFAAVCFLSLAVFLTGCVSTVDGRTKAGFPVKDKIYSRYERTEDQILAAAREVLNHNGQIQSDDSIAHGLHAKVNQHDVWIKTSKVDDKVSEVVVQARKGAAGDVDLASEISKQIAIQLAVNQ
jgi:hypothetical protein